MKADVILAQKMAATAIIFIQRTVKKIVPTFGLSMPDINSPIRLPSGVPMLTIPRPIMRIIPGRQNLTMATMEITLKKAIGEFGQVTDAMALMFHLQQPPMMS